MERTSENMGTQAEKIDKGVATLREQNGRIMSSLKGKREVQIEQYRKLGATITKAKATRNSKNIINGWAEANVKASKRHGSGSQESATRNLSEIT